MLDPPFDPGCLLPPQYSTHFATSISSDLGRLGRQRKDGRVSCARLKQTSPKTDSDLQATDLIRPSAAHVPFQQLCPSSSFLWPPLVVIVSPDLDPPPRRDLATDRQMATRGTVKLAVIAGALARTPPLLLHTGTAPDQTSSPVHL